MARISAGRKARQQRAVAVLCGSVSALVLLISGCAWAISSYVNGHVGRVNAGTAGTPSSGPLNILVAGVDKRTGLTRYEQARLHVGSAAEHELRHHDDRPRGRRSQQRVGGQPAARLLGRHSRARHEQDQRGVRAWRPEADGADRGTGHRADHQRLHRGELPRVRQGDQRPRRREHLPAVRGERLVQRPAHGRRPASRERADRRWSSPGTGIRSRCRTWPGSATSSSCFPRC